MSKKQKSNRRFTCNSCGYRKVMEPVGFNYKCPHCNKIQKFPNIIGRSKYNLDKND